MSLRKKPLRVLPNPWIFIHPDHGPQGACHVDTRGRGSLLGYVGAEFDPEKTVITEERPEGDTRGHRQTTVFRFPALNATLDGPAEGSSGIEIGTTPYYIDRLRDGSLVPADEATAAQVPCMFKSIAEARTSGIAECDAHFGEGAFVKAFPALAPKLTTTATTRGSK